jgi:hypothetical protein
MTRYGLPYVAKTKKKVLVFGGRDFADWPLLKKKMDFFTLRFDECAVIVGCKPSAGGPVNGGFFRTEADRLGERWGHYHRHLVFTFPPNKEKYGSPACFHIRNKLMVEFCAADPMGCAVGFHDGESRGTASMIELCRSAGIPLRIVRYTPESSQKGVKFPRSARGESR